MYYVGTYLGMQIEKKKDWLRHHCSLPFQNSSSDLMVSKEYFLEGDIKLKLFLK